MRLLVDTQILLWLLGDPGRLSAHQSQALADGGNEVLVSVASIWEIAIKVGLGKLQIPLSDFPAKLEAVGMEVLPIALPHALAAASMPRHHGDPFDRMIIAQARIEGLIIVTADRQFARYDVPMFE